MSDGARRTGDCTRRLKEIWEKLASSEYRVLAEMAKTADATTSTQRELVPPEHYMGATFRFDEIVELLRRLTGGTVAAERLSIGHTAGWIEKA